MRSVGLAALAVVLVVAAVLFVRSGGGTNEPTPVSTGGTEDGAGESAVGATSPNPGDDGDEAEPTGSGDSATPDVDYPVEYQEATCQFNVPAGQAPDCGYLVVPQDRTNPDGRQVRIHVAVFSSESETPAPDPVIYLEGGPGGEVMEALDFSFEDRFAPFLESRDLIIFDQRGTGFSEPSLSCQAYRDLSFELLDDLLSPAESLDREYEVLAECRDGFIADGVDLAHYNSATIANDVADLRTALGIEEWNLYGISYGTRLALTVMRDHPEGIRSVILDSVYPPEVDGIANIPANADRAFDTLFSGCAADTECSTAFPNLQNRFLEAIAAADAEPLTIEVVDFFTGDTYEALLDGGDVVGLVFQGLYSESIIPTLPQLIVDVDEGNYRDLANLVSLFVANGEFFSVGMHASVQCYEEVPYSDQAETAAAAEEYPVAGRVVAGSITQSPEAQEFCELWGSGAGPSLEADPVMSEVPTLVMAGQYDPITPPSDGVAVAERLATATYAEFPGLGHAVSTAHPCPTAITLAFLDAPESDVDLGCVADMGGPDFGVPGETAEVGALVPFEDTLAGVSGVVPADWESVGFGSYARQQSALDQTALIQQAVPGGSSDLILGLLSSQLGLEDPEPFDEVEAGDRLWTRYEGEIQGFTADIALADADGLTYLVVLVSDPGERDLLVEQVLLPVLASIASA